MIRQSVVDRLHGANTRLQAALVAGEDTLPHRNLIERLEANIVDLDAEALRVESAEIAKSANDQADLAASIAQKAGAGIETALAKHPVTTLQSEDGMKTNPAVISAANALAAAQSKFKAANMLYQEADIRTASVRSRLINIEIAAASIPEQRRSGQLTDREAAGMIALNHEDQSDLRKLLAVAECDQNLLVPSVELVRQAQESLDHAVKVATFDTLAQRAKEAEAAFLAIVADVYEAGRSMGRSSMLGASWVPTNELTYMISSGQPPGGRNAH